MAVKDWFAHWLDRHQSRHPRGDWPPIDSDTELYPAWVAAFIRRGLNVESVADEASMRMVESPPVHLNEHLPRLLAEAAAIWKEDRAEARAAAPDSREAAAIASRDCDDCGGQGLAVRFRTAARLRRDPAGRPLESAAVTCYCRCPLGRWTEATHRRESPDVHRRIPDLADPRLAWLDHHRTPDLAAISDATLAALADTHPAVRRALADRDEAEARRMFEPAF